MLQHITSHHITGEDSEMLKTVPTPSTLWCVPPLVAVLVLLSAAPCQAVLHFTSNLYEATMSETAPIGSTVVTLTAIPGTPGSSLVYHLFSHPPSVFQIDSATGVITLAGTLDYEQVTSYTFNAEVIEGADSVMTTLIVNVINEDDNPLTCARRLLVVAIPEGPPDPSVIPLNCTDRDEPSPTSISYQIVSSEDTGLFSTDTTGNILIMSDLDYEQQALHEVVVNVSNSGVLAPRASVLLTLLVVVDPKNEHSPVFEDGNAFSFSVSESAAVGTTIGTLSASDADQGEDGVLTFSTEPGSPPSVVVVGPSTGHIVLVQSLDYEQATLHEFTVTVSDNSLDETERLSATATVSLHVENSNEGTPSFSQDVYSEIVSEIEPPGSTVTTVQCTDTDLNSVLTYSLIPGDHSSFNINPSSGVITLASMLEYEADSHTLQLSVQCEDSGDPSRSAQVPFLVEIEGQNAIIRLPSLPVSEYLVDLHEDFSPGNIIATIAASDSNRGLLGSLQFSLAHSIHCPENLFHIDPVSGAMYTIGFLDYESASGYLCVVSIFNSDSPQDTRADVDVIITVIDINDEPPVCSPTLYTIVIPEDSTVGSSIVTLSCSDADSSSLHFSLMDTSTPFQLSPSGVQATLLLQSPVNADTFSTYNLHVNVSDGEFWTVLYVLVYVDSSNEHTPQFSSSVYDCEIPEAAEIGTNICSMTATDRDSGPDGDIHYSILGGNEYHTFAINAENGSIVLAGYIDYEEVNGYIISVSASDNGDPALSSSAQVRIRLVDSNDNAPAISSLITVSVAENATIDTIIANIQCSDLDSGVNGELTLSILHTQSIRSDGEHMVNGIFTIDSSTNDLILSSTLDYEENTLLQVSIECRDNGTPSLGSHTLVLVSVIPINEYSPHFSQDSYSITIAESSTPGTTVLEVMATDMDAGLDGRVQYSIASAGAGVIFLQIGSTTGSIGIAQQANCDWGREHDFIITAVDMGSPARSSEIELHVTLDNCRLGQLSPRHAVYFASAPENSAVGTAILNVSCSSSRTWGEAFAPEYTMSSVSSPFQVDQLTGEISVSTPPDYEQATSHMIQVTCSDPNDFSSYANFFVYVTILPENEHAPEFFNSSYQSETSEDTLPGTSILQVEARDADTNGHGDVMYSIEGDQSVTVNPYTGIIYLTKFLDRELESVMLFHVVAYDQAMQGSGVRSSTAEVRVSITDVNDHHPECDQVVYHISASPLVDVGHSLLHIQCSDLDTGPNSELHYTLSADTEEYFSLEEETGELILRQKFDSESPPLHYIPITVQDSGTPPLSTSVFVVVDLQSTYAATSGSDIIDTEGLKNTATLTLEDLSRDLWSDGAEESFQSAVARSVTHYCALLPNTCSLESGCAGFHRRKRSATEDFYIAFSELNVVLLNNHLVEFTSPHGVGYLNVTFYVSLPERAARATYRTTDYVIPGNTLAVIVDDEEPVIQAQVRDSVAPSLTNRESASGDKTLVWAVPISALAVSALALTLIIMVVRKAVMYRKKRASKVVPISLEGDKGRMQTETSAPYPDNRRKKQKKETSIRLLVQRNSGPSIFTESPHSADLTSDDLSTILLDQEVDESILGHPRSSRSPTDDLSDFNLSSPSSGKSGNNSSVSGDYMQNFPFEPPRTDRVPRVLRVGHARVRTGWLDDS